VAQHGSQGCYSEQASVVGEQSCSEGEREAQYASPVLFFEGNAVATKKRDAKGRFSTTDEDENQKPVAKKKTAKRTKSCKRYAKERVSEEWPEIVKKLVTKAKTGSYNHTKLLVEVSGIKDEESRPVRRGHSKLAKILLKKLSEKEAEQGKR
jgi:hypothetical protein